MAKTLSAFVSAEHGGAHRAKLSQRAVCPGRDYRGFHRKGLKSKVWGRVGLGFTCLHCAPLINRPFLEQGLQCGYDYVRTHDKGGFASQGSALGLRVWQREAGKGH